MTQTFSEYTPANVWEWNTENGGQFAKINRPVAGATHDKERPVGRHPMQLYSLGTPNGVKVTVLLEELLALGHVGQRGQRHARQRHERIKVAAGEFIASADIEGRRCPAGHG